MAQSSCRARSLSSAVNTSTSPNRCSSLYSDAVSAGRRLPRALIALGRIGAARFFSSAFRSTMVIRPRRVEMRPALQCLNSKCHTTEPRPEHQEQELMRQRQPGTVDAIQVAHRPCQALAQRIEVLAEPRWDATSLARACMFALYLARPAGNRARGASSCLASPTIVSGLCRYSVRDIQPILRACNERMAGMGSSHMNATELCNGTSGRNGSPEVQELLEFSRTTLALQTPSEVLDALHLVSRGMSSHQSVLGALRFPLQANDWEAIRLGKPIFLHKDVPDA
jgi:hypothetical protein